jgi:hypothetical protein
MLCILIWIAVVVYWIMIARHRHAGEELEAAMQIFMSSLIGAGATAFLHLAGKCYWALTR